MMRYHYLISYKHVGLEGGLCGFLPFCREGRPKDYFVRLIRVDRARGCPSQPEDIGGTGGGTPPELAGEDACATYGTLLPIAGNLCL
jgi:hypothetical protein